MLFFIKVIKFNFYNLGDIIFKVNKEGIKIKSRHSKNDGLEFQLFFIIIGIISIYQIQDRPDLHR